MVMPCMEGAIVLKLSTKAQTNGLAWGRAGRKQTQSTAPARGVPRAEWLFRRSMARSRPEQVLERGLYSLIQPGRCGKEETGPLQHCRVIRSSGREDSSDMSKETRRPPQS